MTYLTERKKTKYENKKLHKILSIEKLKTSRNDTNLY